MAERRMFAKTIIDSDAFIDNPFNKPQVNHIDLNGENNNISNLEWVTNIENRNHKPF